MTELTPKNFDRLAKAMMQRHGVNYSRALEMLRELKLHLVCDESIRDSASLQAAVLTAINTGKRAFRGGVTISLPPNVALHLPWRTRASFNDVASELGALAVTESPDAAHSGVAFGTASLAQNGLRVLCDGWRGGVLPSHFQIPRLTGVDFALGGVFAGALAVGRSFLSASQISHRDVTEATGLSLWRPDLCWLSADSVGPKLEQFPAKLWLLGLGHLGQAYTWTLGMLPFNPTEEFTLCLQDFDVAEEGNWSAGLLCEPSKIGKLKTRICADWLEERGFRTRLVERPFDSNTRRTGKEPRVALCGFDNPEGRQLLEDAGFDLVVECGLGANLDRFDRIILHTFPEASARARDIWSKPLVQSASIAPANLGEPEDGCGIVLQEIAGKAISSAFTGACAGALVVAEVLRAIHGGKRCEFIALELRDLARPQFPYRDECYQLRVARNGLIPAGFASD